MRLLIVEDDLLLQEAVKDYFESKGWDVLATDSGAQALSLIDKETVHLVLLDVMLPGINGFTVCRKIREQNRVPVIFMTARVQEEDQLNGYAMGGDDYVTKPFSMPVLYAKAMAVVSRSRDIVDDEVCKVGPVTIRRQTHEVFCDGKPVALAPIEYEMLLFFAENPSRIYSREQLLIRFWGYDFEGNDRVVDNHIKKLRQALGRAGRMIATVRKSGYMLDPKGV